MTSRVILPVGLIGALLLALLLPQPGLWFVRHQLTFCCVAAMFLINGYQTERPFSIIGKRFLGAFLLAAVISLVAGGYLAHLLTSVGQWDAMLALGIVTMCMMPPTLSSVVVVTAESGGNTLWSLMMTIGLSLLSIVTIPLLLPRLLTHAVITLPVQALFVDLLTSVLLPLLIGMALRRSLQKAPSPFINRVPTYLIIVLSYISFSAGREKIISNSFAVIAHIVAASLIIHLVLLGISRGVAMMCNYTVDEQKALTFIGAQKTLPTAISVLASLGVAGAGAAVPCVIFYLVQQLVDAIIAYRWHARTVMLEEVEDNRRISMR